MTSSGLSRSEGPTCVDLQHRDLGQYENDPVHNACGKESRSQVAGWQLLVTDVLECDKVLKCKYNIVRNGETKHLCDDECFKTFRAKPTSFLHSTAARRAVAASECDYCHAAVSTDQFTHAVGKASKTFCQLVSSFWNTYTVLPHENTKAVPFNYFKTEVHFRNLPQGCKLHPACTESAYLLRPVVWTALH